MEKVKSVVWTQKFEEDFKKIKDRTTQDRLEKQIMKIRFNLDFGKPLRYDLKGERTIYVKPYRLVYKAENDTLVLLRFEHRESAYK